MNGLGDRFFNKTFVTKERAVNPMIATVKQLNGCCVARGAVKQGSAAMPGSRKKEGKEKNPFTVRGG